MPIAICYMVIGASANAQVDSDSLWKRWTDTVMEAGKAPYRGRMSWLTGTFASLSVVSDRECRTTCFQLGPETAHMEGKATPDAVRFRCYRSTDLGESWQVVGSRFFDSLGLIPATMEVYHYNDSLPSLITTDRSGQSSRLFLLLNRRLWYSDNLGEDWQASIMDTSTVSRVLPGQSFPNLWYSSTRLTVCRATNNQHSRYYLIAAVNDHHLYRSTDSGASWQAFQAKSLWNKASNDDVVGEVEASPDGKRIYATITTNKKRNDFYVRIKAIAYSDDGGSTWNTRELPSDALAGINYTHGSHYIIALKSSTDVLLFLIYRGYYYRLTGSTLVPTKVSLPDSVGLFNREQYSDVFTFISLQPLHYGWIYVSTDKAKTWQQYPRVLEDFSHDEPGNSPICVHITHDGRILTSPTHAASYIFECPKRIPIPPDPYSITCSPDTLRLRLPRFSRAAVCDSIQVVSSEQDSLAIALLPFDKTGRSSIPTTATIGYAITPKDTLALPTGTQWINICYDPTHGSDILFLLRLHAENPPPDTRINGVCYRRWQDSVLVVVERFSERAAIVADTVRTFRGGVASLSYRLCVRDTLPAGAIQFSIRRPSSIISTMMATSTAIPPVSVTTTMLSDGRVEISAQRAERLPPGDYPLFQLHVPTVDTLLPYRPDTLFLHTDGVITTPTLDVTLSTGMVIRDTAAIVADTITGSQGASVAFTLRLFSSSATDTTALIETTLRWDSTYFTPATFLADAGLPEGWSVQVTPIDAKQWSIRCVPGKQPLPPLQRLGQIRGTVSTSAPLSTMSLLLDSARIGMIPIPAYNGLLQVMLSSPLPTVRFVADTINATTGDTALFTLRLLSDVMVTAEQLKVVGRFDSDTWQPTELQFNPMLGLEEQQAMWTIGVDSFQLSLTKSSLQIQSGQVLGWIRGVVTRNANDSMPLLLTDGSIRFTGDSSQIAVEGDPGLLRHSSNGGIAMTLAADTAIGRVGDTVALIIRLYSDHAAAITSAVWNFQYDPTIVEFLQNEPVTGTGWEAALTTTDANTGRGRCSINWLQAPQQIDSGTKAIMIAQMVILRDDVSAMPFVMSDGYFARVASSEQIIPRIVPGLVQIKRDSVVPITGTLSADTIHCYPGTPIRFSLRFHTDSGGVAPLYLLLRYNPLMFRADSVTVAIAGYDLQQRSDAQVGTTEIWWVPTATTTAWHQWKEWPIGYLYGHGYLGNTVTMPVTIDSALSGENWKLQKNSGAMVIDSVCGLNFRMIEANAAGYGLLENRPNPFNPTTELQFSVGLDGPVIVRVTNIMGEEVARPVAEYLQAGAYKVRFNAASLPSGLYRYCLESGDYHASRWMVLAR